MPNSVIKLMHQDALKALCLPAALRVNPDEIVSVLFHAHMKAKGIFCKLHLPEFLA